MGKQKGKTAPRRKRDRTPMVDMGTPELQAKRRAVLGVGKDMNVSNIQYSDYPLGVLFVRQLVTVDQHDAGVHFAALARSTGALGRTGAVTGQLDGDAGMDTTGGDGSAKSQADYREAVAALKTVRGKVFDIAFTVAVLEAHPYARGSIEVLRKGLDILVPWHQGKLRARRREKVAA